MLGTKSLIAAVMVFFTVAIVIFHTAFAGEVRAPWEDEWDRTVKAAEQEGQVVLYSLSEIGDAIANTSFQKKFPKIKISVVTARGGEHVSRLMAERRAGKFLADIGNLGNTSPYTLYQSKTLDPIASAFILPEVKDESKWWQGKQQFIDPENRYILVYVGAPLFLVGYNTKLVRSQRVQILLGSPRSQVEGKDRRVRSQSRRLCGYPRPLLLSQPGVGAALSAPPVQRNGPDFVCALPAG